MSDDFVSREGYERALELLVACSTEDGFLAATENTANYRRVWGRDGSIAGLAALASGQDDLIATTRRTLETLAAHQGPHGEIPSNVDVRTERISYGGTTGRVDANLWFSVACGQYFERTGDEEFLDTIMPTLEAVRFLLGAWEFNARGLLYVPATGDWADEYVHAGYVLYDQLLYLQAMREFCRLHEHVHGSRDHELCDRTTRLERIIRTNYWIDPNGDEIPPEAYHEVLYAKARDVSADRRGCYWLPFFAPGGYGYRFDAFANVLASLFGVSDEEQCGTVDDYVVELTDDSWLLPAFHPVITPRHEDWTELQVTFSYEFKNEPHEYHNGGRWPLVTGFHVADLARRDQLDRARSYLQGIHRANRSPDEDGEPWSFPEFLHGTEHTPGGTRDLAWSAAAAVIGEHAVRGEPILR